MQHHCCWPTFLDLGKPGASLCDCDSNKWHYSGCGIVLTESVRALQVCPKNAGNFNVDNVRVVKIPGSGIESSVVVSGMVLKRDVEGTVKSVTDGKVAVYAQGIDTSSTETKVCA